MAVLAKLMEEIAREIVENDVTFGRSGLNKLLGALSVDDDGSPYLCTDALPVYDESRSETSNYAIKSSRGKVLGIKGLLGCKKCLLVKALFVGPFLNIAKILGNRI